MLEVALCVCPCVSVSGYFCLPVRMLMHDVDMLVGLQKEHQLSSKFKSLEEQVAKLSKELVKETSGTLCCA